jgi:hypothetical protein
VGVWTALPERGQGWQTGTSFAVPYVTSVIAATYGSLERKSKSDILEQLAVQDLGAPGKDRVFGRGLVQAPEQCRGVAAPTERVGALDSGQRS